jgi:hypothetical protein
MKRLSLLALVAFSATLFSFSPYPGGEHFEVYLNNKLLIQHIVGRQTAIQNLALSPTDPGKLSIKYDHCGTIGKSRSLSIKDASDKTLRTWKFPDTSENSNGRMTLEVEEIVKLIKGVASPLQLTYTSHELPKGRVLVSVTLSGVEVVSKN